MRFLFLTASAMCLLASLVRGQGTDAAAEIPAIQAILREASALMPAIDEVQQSSVAANIAGQQVRAQDLEGALKTAKSLAKPSDDYLAVSLLRIA